MPRLPPLLEDHFRHPRRAGGAAPEAVSGTGENQACGDRVVIHLARGADGRLAVSFQARGCSATIACASLIASEAHGCELAQLQRLDAALEVERAGGLALMQQHAVEVVARALAGALARAAPACHS